MELKKYIKAKKKNPGNTKYLEVQSIEDRKNSIQRFVFKVIKASIKKKFLRGD